MEGGRGGGGARDSLVMRSVPPRARRAWCSIYLPWRTTAQPCEEEETRGLPSAYGCASKSRILGKCAI